MERDAERAEFIASTLPALDALYDEGHRASPYDQLSRAIVEFGVLVRTFRRLEFELEPILAWRSGGMADVMERALKELFPIDERKKDAGS